MNDENEQPTTSPARPLNKAEQLLILQSTKLAASMVMNDTREVIVIHISEEHDDGGLYFHTDMEPQLALRAMEEVLAKLKAHRDAALARMKAASEIPS